MNLKDFRTIALHAARKTVPSNFQQGDVDMDTAFADGLRELAGTVNQFMKNRYDIYDIMVEIADEIVPNNVVSGLSPFAEVKVVGQNQKAIFKRKVGKTRAKKFLTQVGLSGVYETFRLDTETYELNTSAVGGGATIDFERMMDQVESLSDVMEIITEGLTDAVFLEVQKALRSAYDATSRPSANKYSSNTFDADKMVGLMTTVRAYAPNCVIFAPPEFVAKMGADAIVPGTSSVQGVYSPKDIEAIHATGAIEWFRGAPVVKIPQSFVDENNDKTQIDPQIAYVLPAGKEKVVKVALEGPTQIHDFKNRDNSLEVYAYKKIGVGIEAHHNWAIYKNTGITQTYSE